MSSSAGGSSANHGRAADGHAHGDGLPADHDPVRSSPPADPWFDEAPTSALDQTPPPDPPRPADTPPLADTAPLTNSAPPPGTAPPWGSEEPPRSRRGRWVLAVLVICAVFIGGMLAWDQFGGDEDTPVTSPSPSPARATTPAPTRGTAPAAAQPVATTSAGPSTPTSAGSGAGGPVVVYQVTASGEANTGSVSYTDQDGDIIRLNGIKLPWRVTFPLGGQQKPPLVLISQRHGGGDAGPVTCTITMGGKLLSSTTANGRYASAQCSG